MKFKNLFGNSKKKTMILTIVSVTTVQKNH